eukprot:scaffold4846_cov99-Isochrysis_galbana.AAC.2
MDCSTDPMPDSAPRTLPAARADGLWLSGVCLSLPQELSVLAGWIFFGRLARSQSNFRQNARSQSNCARSQTNRLRFGVFFV